jgi:hypothetical protein
MLQLREPWIIAMNHQTWGRNAADRGQHRQIPNVDLYVPIIRNFDGTSVRQMD